MTRGAPLGTPFLLISEKTELISDAMKALRLSSAMALSELCKIFFYSFKKVRFSIMRLKKLVYTFALAVSGMLLTGCYKNVGAFRLETSEAPEVYGVNRNLDKHSSIQRFHGRIGIDPEESIHVDVTERIESLDESKEVITRGIYVFGGFSFEGGYDVFYKWDLFVFGLGATVSDDLHYHISLGVNTQYFEMGVFTGLFHQYTRLSYRELCDHTYCSEDNNAPPDISSGQNYTLTSSFGGLYVGVFFGDIFINYTFSSYTPDLGDAAIIKDIPSIDTHYFTLGYRFDDTYEIVGGAILSVVEDEQHLGAGLGVIFYPF